MSLKSTAAGNYLSVVDGPALLSSVDECSIFAWCKYVDSTAASWALLTTQLAYTEADTLGLISTGTAGNYRAWVEAGSTASVIDTGVGVTVNTWTSFGASYKKSQTPSSNAYVAGTEYAGGNTNASQMGTTAMDTVFILSSTLWGGTKGSVAHVTIWNKKLTAANFTSLNGGTNPLDIENASIVFYAPLTSDTVVVKPIGYPAWTTTGSPTIDADNPTVAAPSGGGGIAKRVMAIQSMMRNQ